MKVSDANLPMVVATLTGTYASIFYIMGNLTLLPVMSMIVIFLALTIPITIAIVFSTALLRITHKDSYLGTVTAFIAVLYLLVILREPVFAAQSVADFRSQFAGVSWYLIHVIIFVVPAALIAFIFRRNLGKYSVILAVMSLAAIALRIATPAVTDTKWRATYINNTGNYLPSVTLSQKPNIYLILADGYGSLAFMRENDVDVSSFRDSLESMNFRFYDEMFSNYHATTSAMLAMLDMEHHFYLSTFKGSEVGKTAREIIGGRNNLLRLLKGNGYQTEYIHQGNYLLLRGCTADFCYPNPSSAVAAQNVLGEILPYSISSRFSATRTKWQKQPLEKIEQMILDRVELSIDAPNPYFRYIHLFEPGHAPNHLVGTCNEADQLETYSKKIMNANDYLSNMVERITSHDESAVIVVTGDHGPFISQQCNPYIDVDVVSEYRDRVGALLAIRWPDSYHGQFDSSIKTSVNLFRYVLASLATDNTALLETLVPDDVYVQGAGKVLKIVSDGEMIVPPEIFAIKAEQE